MSRFLDALSSAVWGLPTAALILGAGIYLSIRLGFPQITRISGIFRSIRGDKASGAHISPFQSLATSLSATVGTGSVVGVAAALTVGGAGAIFWMWVSAFFGMSVAYAEGALSVRYRRVRPDGSRTGGIWFALRDGLGMPVLAGAYALFCLLVSFGMGTAVQINSAAEALSDGFSLSPVLCGIGCSALLAFCLFGGQKSAARLCSRAMPVLAGLYILGALAVIIKNIDALVPSLCAIFRSAFGIRQVGGGVGGMTLAMATGFRRGVFSNEAGLGTTAPVHASSSVDDPDRQGLMNMFEVTADTFVICTLTALAILCSGAYPGSEGAALIAESIGGVFGPMSKKLVALSIAGFAAATAVGWSQIGSAAAEYLFGGRLLVFRLLTIAAAFFGAVTGSTAVWQLSDIFNGLMVLPCLTAVLIIPLGRGHSTPRK